MFILVLLCVAGIEGAFPTPGLTWPEATPESQGFDPVLLDAAFEYAERGGGAGLSQTFCVGVYRNGYRVKEVSFVGNSSTAWIYWSVTKAVTHTLLGIAERDGLLKTEDYARDHGITEWLTTRAVNVTIDQLQRHDSGRWYDFVTDFLRSQEQESQTQFAIDLPQQHDPMTLYQYNQMGIQNLERILAHVTGMPLPEYAARELWEILGYESDYYFQNWQVGNRSFITDYLTYMGQWTHCNDLARFGALWLNKGTWGGNTTIFTEEYYNKALTTNPDGRPGRRYHWGGPPNHRANGLGDQLVTFNPEESLVIARLGDPLQISFSGSEFIQMVLDSIVAKHHTESVYDIDEDDGVMPEEELQLQAYLREHYITDKQTGRLEMK